MVNAGAGVASAPLARRLVSAAMCTALSAGPRPASRSPTASWILTTAERAGTCARPPRHVAGPALARPQTAAIQPRDVFEDVRAGDLVHDWLFRYACSLTITLPPAAWPDRPLSGLGQI